MPTHVPVGSKVTFSIAKSGQDAFGTPCVVETILAVTLSDIEVAELANQSDDLFTGEVHGRMAGTVQLQVECEGTLGGNPAVFTALGELDFLAEDAAAPDTPAAADAAPSILTLSVVPE